MGGRARPAQRRPGRAGPPLHRRAAVGFPADLEPRHVRRLSSTPTSIDGRHCSPPQPTSRRIAMETPAAGATPDGITSFHWTLADRGDLTATPDVNEFAMPRRVARATIPGSIPHCWLWKRKVHSDEKISSGCALRSVMGASLVAAMLAGMLLPPPRRTPRRSQANRRQLSPRIPCPKLPWHRCKTRRCRSIPLRMTTG